MLLKLDSIKAGLKLSGGAYSRLILYPIVAPIGAGNININDAIELLIRHEVNELVVS